MATLPVNGNGTPRFATNTSLVSDTHFSTPIHFDELLRFLREQKTTGQLVIHLHQGGIQRVNLAEKSPVDLVDE